jgi:hypothetical protein
LNCGFLTVKRVCRRAVLRWMMFSATMVTELMVKEIACLRRCSTTLH